MEILILELNSPVNQSSSERVQEIQRRIQQLQRERSGWQKGFELLGSEDQTLRFYGALTLTIKINADWEIDGLSDDESARRTLLEGLISAYVQLANASDSQLVLLKLCSTITAYFINTEEWRLPFRHVLASLLSGRCVPVDHIRNGDDLLQSLSSATFRQLRAALWFATNLVEEVDRLDTGTLRSSEVVERLRSNSEDLWLVLKTSLDFFVHANGGVSGETRIVPLGLPEYEAVEIVKIILPLLVPCLRVCLPPEAPEQRASDRSDVDLAYSCITDVFACFTRDGLQDLAIQTLTSLVESYSQIFRHIGLGAAASITTSTQAATWFDEMQRGEFSPEAVRYVEFLIAIIRLENLSSPAYLHDKQTLANVVTLKELMHCDGAAVIEDEICQLVLECLNEVLEQYNEWTVADQADETMRSFTTGVCLAAIAKSQLPIEEMDNRTETWDADDRARFQDFRHDVVDYLTAAFVTLGAPLIESLVGNAVLTGRQVEWPAFEASLFWLLEFSDIMDTNPELLDRIVLAVLQSPAWTAITDTRNDNPTKAQQTAIKFVAHQTGYLRRNLNFLVPSLEFLFSSLQVPGSTQAASQAIQTLCYSERKVLVEALPQFLGTLPGLTVLDTTAKHRIYNAIAAVIQALPTEMEKTEPLSALLNSISVIFSPPLEEYGSDMAAAMADLLQSLAAMGRGLRAPSDIVIDLDSSDLESDETEFWTSGSGHPIQRKALSLCTDALHVAGVLTTAEIVEAACDFMKSGYTEDDPSPFKFSAATSVDFLGSQIYAESPNIDAVMGCASAFLASANQKSVSPLFDRFMEPVFVTCQTLIGIYEITDVLPTTDFLASSIGLLPRLLPKWTSALLRVSDAQERLAVIFDVVIALFAATDTLSRRCAGSFLAAIFELTGRNSSLPALDLNRLSTILDLYRPRIIALTLKLLAGECARSEIEAVTETLRKIVGNQTAATTRLFKEAMAKEAAILSPRAYAATTSEQRIRFIAQVQSLRGARKTTEVTRDFWIACRGGAFGYVA